MDGQAELAWSNARADVQSGLALAPQRFTSRHPLWADAAPVDITVQLKVGWQILWLTNILYMILLSSSLASTSRAIPRNAESLPSRSRLMLCKLANREHWIQRITFAAETNAMHLQSQLGGQHIRGFFKWYELYKFTFYFLTYLLTYWQWRMCSRGSALRCAVCSRGLADRYLDTQTHRGRAPQYLLHLLSNAVKVKMGSQLCQSSETAMLNNN